MGIAHQKKIPNHILERLFGVGQCPTYTMLPLIGDMELTKRAIPVQARIGATPSPAVLDSRLRGNERGGKVSGLFLVTPLRGVTFSWALYAISDMADQCPALYLAVF